MGCNKFSVGEVRYVCNVGEDPKLVKIVAIGKDYVEIQYTHGSKNKVKFNKCNILLTEKEMLNWKEKHKPKTLEPKPNPRPKKPKSKNGYRETHCYRCSVSLIGYRQSICPVCKWIRCYRCGACNCNRND